MFSFWWELCEVVQAMQALALEGQGLWEHSLSPVCWVPKQAVLFEVEEDVVAWSGSTS